MRHKLLRAGIRAAILILLLPPVIAKAGDNIPEAQQVKVRKVQGTLAETKRRSNFIRKRSAAPVAPSTKASLNAPPLNPDSIQAGTSRDELVRTWGTPTSKVIIPENGHLLEVYRYTSHGYTASVVRLNDGVITSIQKPSTH